MRMYCLTKIVAIVRVSVSILEMNFVNMNLAIFQSVQKLVLWVLQFHQELIDLCSILIVRLKLHK